MSHGFNWKKGVGWPFFMASGPFFAAGLLLTHFPQKCDNNILTCDQLKFIFAMYGHVM